jgi:hypothetical protein
MGKELHPSIPALLEFFNYDHLPPELQKISKPFYELAHKMAEDLDTQHIGAGAQLNRGIQKLLESKDCMVRAAVVINRGE